MQPKLINFFNSHIADFIYETTYVRKDSLTLSWALVSQCLSRLNIVGFVRTRRKEGSLHQNMCPAYARATYHTLCMHKEHLIT